MATTRGKAVFGGALIGLVALALTLGSAGSLFAQEQTPGPDMTPMNGDMGMMGGQTPAAGAAEMTAQMRQMMEQCQAMMEMMTQMMGMMDGDMAGMMDGAEMPAMPAPTATPGQ